MWPPFLASARLLLGIKKDIDRGRDALILPLTGWLAKLQ